MPSATTPPATSSSSPPPPPAPLLNIPPFETTFAVPMHCKSCTDSITSAVLQVPGIQSASCDLSASLLTARGTAAPSAILAAVQSTGRDAVLRGSGAGDASAAVAILETYDGLAQQKQKQNNGKAESPVRGLVRIVEVADGLSVLDVSVGGALGGAGVLGTGEVVGAVGRKGADTGAAKNEDGGERRWRVTLRQCGDLSRGAESTGDIYTGQDMGLGPIVVEEGRQPVPRGAVGYVGVSASGKGAAVLVHPISVWEVIGRGVVVEDERTGEKVAGVVARSAGVWGNDKTVCSCSGKTVWEEREEQRGRGML